MQLQALKMEEGAESQEMCAGSRSRKRQVSGFSSRDFRKECIDFSLMNPVSDF